jgi:hypothetical protein
MPVDLPVDCFRTIIRQAHPARQPRCVGFFFSKKIGVIVRDLGLVSISPVKAFRAASSIELSASFQGAEDAAQNAFAPLAWLPQADGEGGEHSANSCSGVTRSQSVSI